MRTKDGALEGASSAVKNLELTQATSVSDLQNRVGRWVTSIHNNSSENDQYLYISRFPENVTINKIRTKRLFKGFELSV